MSSNTPFSARRLRHDFLDALPAVGIVLGAVVGVLVGAVVAGWSMVASGGIGILAGLVLGVLFRSASKRTDP